MATVSQIVELRGLFSYLIWGCPTAQGFAQSMCHCLGLETWAKIKRVWSFTGVQ